MNWELGVPKVYVPGDMPLSEATVWPDDFQEYQLRWKREVGMYQHKTTYIERESAIESWVEHIERLGRRRLGLMPCEGDHLQILGGEMQPRRLRPCPECRAAI